ncbi:uncharacterized protein LOC105701128 [Orussus abietinus]|uniref:uncharacterized protein LOC105701128 n=1 Tax=Orussus abietinus TaxID=222816 RepID=UPI000625B42D|nr:uncharacterized protein LOC105701128 [Orussus abietinus]
MDHMEQEGDMWAPLAVALLLSQTVFASFEDENLSNSEDAGDAGKDTKMSEFQDPIKIQNASPTPDPERDEATFKLETDPLLKLFLTRILEEAGRKGIDETENRRKRSTDEVLAEDTAKRRDGTTLSAWLYWPIRQKQVFPADHRDTAQEKKSPAFNPWGGKRFSYDLFPNIRRPMRVPFNSWGGKRDGKNIRRLAEDKRTKFFNWGGKRTSFNSWGGKRDWEIANPCRTIAEDPERNSKNALIYDKRSEDKLKDPEEVEEKTSTQNDEKRVRFNSWGGKRFIHPSLPKEISEMHNYADEFSDEWLIAPNKRDGNNARSRIIFVPWGGKRNTNEDILNPNPHLTHQSVNIRKVFFPWGG